MKTNTSNLSQKNSTAICNKKRELSAYVKLLAKIEDNDKFEIAMLDTLLLNVCPTYSNAISMWTVHRFTDADDPMEMMFVEVPKETDNYRAFELQFVTNFQNYKGYFNNFILLTYNNNQQAIENPINYEWIINCIKDEGFTEDNILTAALFQHKDSSFKCDIVGEEYEGEMTFYFENKNAKELLTDAISLEKE